MAWRTARDMARREAAQSSKRRVDPSLRGQWRENKVREGTKENSQREKPSRNQNEWNSEVITLFVEDKDGNNFVSSVIKGYG